MRVLIFILFLLSPLVCQAQGADRSGGGVGNGGDVVACDETAQLPFQFPTYFGYLPLEVFRAHFEAKTEAERRNLDAFEAVPWNAINGFFITKLGKVPAFLETFRSAAREVGYPRERKVLSRDRLTDIGDDMFLGPLPAGCHKVQAIIRRGLTFYWDEDVHYRMGIREVQFMRLHEILYYLGASKFGHRSSLKTQNLLIFLILHSPSTQQLEMYLRENFY